MLLQINETDTASDPRWASIVRRERSADGALWYSVVTTGVYCRPSCPSRVAKPENVRIHDTIAQARATGARPCLRCRPDDASCESAQAALVASACRLIEAREERVTLAELAREIGLSPWHFQRVFKAVTGLSPRGYAEALRSGRLRDALRKGTSVTDAIHEAGYGSNGGFYAKAEAVLGMKPHAALRGGTAERLRVAFGRCSLGVVLVASSGKGVAAILMGDDPDSLVKDLQDRFPRAALVGGDRDYERRVATVIALVEEPGRGLDLPLDIRGTAFQQRVWNELRRIPPGETATYAEIARRIGAPGAARAVAGACAANALAVAVPCHRVIRHDGAPSGYRWGAARKKALLDREKGGA